MSQDAAQQRIDEDLAKVAQVLAIGTGASQLQAVAEHVAHALEASSVTILAVVADVDSVYIVADSEGRRLYIARSGKTNPRLLAFDLDSLKPAGELDGIKPKVAAEHGAIRSRHG